MHRHSGMKQQQRAASHTHAGRLVGAGRGAVGWEPADAKAIAVEVAIALQVGCGSTPVSWQPCTTAATAEETVIKGYPSCSTRAHQVEGQ